MRRFFLALAMALGIVTSVVGAVLPNSHLPADPGYNPSALDHQDDRPTFALIELDTFTVDGHFEPFYEFLIVDLRSGLAIHAIAPENAYRAFFRDIQSPTGLDFVRIKNGGAFWVVERDGIINRNVREIPIGRVTGNQISLFRNFGGGTISVNDAQSVARHFWDRFPDISSRSGAEQLSYISSALNLKAARSATFTNEGEILHAVKGGQSHTWNTLSFGATDALGATKSEQYQGAEFTGTKVLATIGRESFLTATGVGLASKLSNAAKLAQLANASRKARALQFLASGLNANASATAFSTAVNTSKQVVSGQYDSDSIALSHGGRVGSFLGGGVGSGFSSFWASGLSGGTSYSISQQLIDKGSVDAAEVAWDAALGVGFAYLGNLSSKNSKVELNSRQKLALDKLSRGKDINKAQKRALRDLLQEYAPETFRETMKAFGIGISGEAGDLATGTE